MREFSMSLYYFVLIGNFYTLAIFGECGYYGGVIHVLSYDSVSWTSALRLVANVHAPVLFVGFCRQE